MKTNYVKTLLLAASIGGLFACTGGNQGMNEAGSADSNSMMNVDTQMVDTSGATAPGVGGEAADNQEGNANDTSAIKGQGQVPVPSP